MEFFELYNFNLRFSQQAQMGKSKTTKHMDYKIFNWSFEIQSVNSLENVCKGTQLTQFVIIRQCKMCHKFTSLW